MAMQRLVSDMLEFIYQDQKVNRFRLKWYNEVKIPMLTAGILIDNGAHSL